MDQGERQANLARLIHQPDMVVGAPQEPPAKALPAVLRRGELDPRGKPC